VNTARKGWPALRRTRAARDRMIRREACVPDH
jgi:hypothetical protein